MPLTHQTYSPHNPEKIRKLVVLLHGLGSNGADLISLAPMWADQLPHTLFLAPNAPMPHPMVADGFQWFELWSKTPADWVAGAQSATKLFMPWLNAQLAEHKLNMADVALVGFSQGCMMALHIGLQLEPQVAGILGYSGAFVPNGASPLTSPPIMLVHGTLDSVVPFSSLAASEEALKNLGLPHVHTHPIKNLDHTIDQEGLNVGLGFLQQCLFGKQSSQ
jgi:phospholipase/carboxylesterase